jgi:predicted GH43/DUF377 family glycosyl hydrolase
LRWRKGGRIALPAKRPEWMHSHAALPFAEPLADQQVRVYFSSRDRHNRSHTGSLVVDLREPERILDLSADPVLAPGELGCFDDSGAMACWLTPDGEHRMLYYIGWNLGVTVPFRNAIGLAVSDAGSRFRRHAPGPIVDRSPFEPHFVASCCVLKDRERWRMWYLACVGWELVRGRPRHRYHLRYAESSDGVAWRRDGTVAVDFKDPAEYAISRPSVLRDGQRWKMWYSTRGEQYRIGYAESDDGVRWTRRDDEVGIDASPTGWDSQMIEYPHVFDHAGRRYMLYNGNDYGRTGIGLATLEER